MGKYYVVQCTGINRHFFSPKSRFIRDRDTVYSVSVKVPF